MELEEGKRYKFGVRRRGVVEPVEYTGVYIGKTPGKEIFYWEEQGMPVRVDEDRLVGVEELTEGG